MFQIEGVQRYDARHRGVVLKTDELNAVLHQPDKDRMDIEITSALSQVTLDQLGQGESRITFHFPFVEISIDLGYDNVQSLVNAIDLAHREFVDGA